MNLLPERTRSYFLKVPPYVPGDPYSVLGVGLDCSKRDVVKAFRGIAKRYHPDLLPNDLPPERANSCEAYFHEAVNSREVLMDDNKRALYDKYGFISHRTSNQSNMIFEAKKLLADIFDQMCEKTDDHQSKTSDAIKTITSALAIHKQKINVEVAKITKVVTRYQSVINRTHSETETFLTVKAKQSLERLKQLKINKIGEMMAVDKAVELVKEYKYDFESAPESLIGSTFTVAQGWRAYEGP